MSVGPLGTYVASTSSTFRRRNPMKTTIDNVLVSHDYGGEVYDVTMTARDIHQMYKHGLLVIDPERQRGRNSVRSEEHTSELQSQSNLVCRLLLAKKKH